MAMNDRPAAPAYRTRHCHCGTGGEHAPKCRVRRHGPILATFRDWPREIQPEIPLIKMAIFPKRAVTPVVGL